MASCAATVLCSSDTCGSRVKPQFQIENVFSLLQQAVQLPRQHVLCLYLYPYLYLYPNLGRFLLSVSWFLALLYHLCLCAWFVVCVPCWMLQHNTAVALERTITLHARLHTGAALVQCGGQLRELTRVEDRRYSRCSTSVTIDDWRRHGRLLAAHPRCAVIPTARHHAANVQLRPRSRR